MRASAKNSVPSVSSVDEIPPGAKRKLSALLSDDSLHFPPRGGELSSATRVVFFSFGAQPYFKLHPSSSTLSNRPSLILSTSAQLSGRMRRVSEAGSSWASGHRVGRTARRRSGARASGRRMMRVTS